MISAATSCPKHPEKAAVLACARCGTFACEACRSTDDARLCAECGVRYAAVHFDVGGILQGGFQLLFRHPGAVAALCGLEAERDAGPWRPRVPFFAAFPRRAYCP